MGIAKESLNLRSWNAPSRIWCATPASRCRRKAARSRSLLLKPPPAWKSALPTTGTAFRKQFGSGSLNPSSARGKKMEPGLDLRLCKKIVQDHGGDVQLQRTTQEGSTFVVFLPRARGSQAMPGNARMATQ